jgi:hypothetical protein
MLDALSRSAGRYRGIAVVRNDTGVGEPRTSKAAASVCFLTIAAGHPKCRSGTARFRRTACIGRNTARLCEAIELGQIVRYAISSPRLGHSSGQCWTRTLRAHSFGRQIGRFFRRVIESTGHYSLSSNDWFHANPRRAIFWETPIRLFGFNASST